MLDSLTVVCSDVLLFILSLPVGWLVLEFFKLRSLSQMGFFNLVPLYLGIGLGIQVLISFLCGMWIISSTIPILVSVLSIVILLAHAFMNRNGKIFTFTDKFSISRFLREHRFENLFSIILLASIFGYFSLVPIITKWPPVGDVELHSAITSLIIHNGHISDTLMPLDNFPFPYPTGFHVFSANLSLLMHVFPAEAILLLATFFMGVVSSLLFTLTYSMTRSYWLSLPMPFVIMIPHATHHLGRWIGGFIYNGTYPNLFGFIIALSAAILLQIVYDNRQPISKISTIFIVLMLSLFVTYPSYIFTLIVFLFSYAIVIYLQDLRKFVNEAYLKKKLSAGSSLSSTAHQEKFQQKRPPSDVGIKEFKSYPHCSLSNIRQWPELGGLLVSVIKTKSKEMILLKKRADNKNENYGTKVWKLNVIILVGFIAFFLVSGLVQFYNHMLTYFPSEFQKNKNMSWLDKETIWSNYNSDLLYKALPAAAIACGIIIIIFGLKITPLFFGWLILLFGIILTGLNFIVPQRTLAFVGTLSWSILAYGLVKITPVIIQKNTKIRHLVLGGFVITSFFIIIPHMINNAVAPPGWFLTRTTPNKFIDSYDASLWLIRNVKPSDLILNDRSFASFYIQGFSLLNLTHNYFNGFIKPIQPVLSPKDTIPIRLNAVWLHPYNKALVLSLLQEFKVKYIVLMEGNYMNYVKWGGNGHLTPKDNDRYAKIFDKYSFLQPVFHEGGAFIYKVNTGV